jgi:hypothetical protein
LRVLRFDVLQQYGGFRQVAFVGLEVGHLAQRAGGRIGLADPGQFLLEWNAFFEQGELDLVVVVAGGKATKCEHGGCLLCVVGGKKRIGYRAAPP